MLAAVKIFEIEKYLTFFIFSRISSMNISAFYIWVPYKVVPYKMVSYKVVPYKVVSYKKDAKFYLCYSVLFF